MYTQNVTFNFDRNACHSALKEKHSDISQLQCLDAVFDKAMEAYTPAEVPTYLICPITHEVVRDPVITSSGITYERAALLKSITRAGPVDPITRQDLGLKQLVPNLALREVAERYLLNNNWAYKL